MTKTTDKDRARGQRAEKLAAALRANLARRKQAAAAENAAAAKNSVEPPPADTDYRRRDDNLSPLGGKTKADK